MESIALFLREGGNAKTLPGEKAQLGPQVWDPKSV